MRARRLLLLLPLLLLAAETPSERELIFARFDHGTHQKALDKADLPCSGCHQVGGVALSPEGFPVPPPDEAFLSPPSQACHQCHQAKGKAPRRCDTCHEGVQAPTDHDAGWTLEHGAEARMGVTRCQDCHDDAWCVACHEGGTPFTYRVHDRSWLTVHGIAARTNPAECGTCHPAEVCIDCHRTEP